jgi:hypothetical protein
MAVLMIIIGIVLAAAIVLGVLGFADFRRYRRIRNM